MTRTEGNDQITERMNVTYSGSVSPAVARRTSVKKLSMNASGHTFLDEALLHGCYTHRLDFSNLYKVLNRGRRRKVLCLTALR